MIEKYLIESNYEEKFQGLSTSKQLKSLQICNNVQNEDTMYIIAVDISTKIIEEVEEKLCCISKMHYVNNEMVIAGTITF